MKIADFEVGLDKPFFLIAGPCVIESREFALETAKMIRDITAELGINALYKSSFDKANRTSGTSFRGPGIQEGLEILQEVRETVGMPVLTDVHTPEQVALAAKYVDMIQTPAFLCRQTDLIEAVGACGIPANIKKGQFLSPPEMVNVTKKAEAAGGEGRITVCERGTSFGYMETHPDPANAKSDGPNAWPTQKLKALLATLQQLDKSTKAGGFIENDL